MGMRKGVPHAKCSPLCAIKEKLQELWDRAYGCINKINDITPDGDGKFSIQAGSNIQLTEISNGLKIDTTGGVTYYTTTDPKLDIDNDALTIETAGVASQDDLNTVAGGVTTNANAISDIVDGTTTVGSAAHIVSDSFNAGSDTKPVKIVNGVATPVTNDLTENTTATIPITVDTNYISGGSVTAAKFGKVVLVSLQSVSFIATCSATECITIPNVSVSTASPTPIINWNDGTTHGLMAGTSTGINFWINATGSNIWTTIIVMIN